MLLSLSLDFLAICLSLTWKYFILVLSEYFGWNTWKYMGCYGDYYSIYSPTLYSQITGNTESRIPWYPPPLSNILLLLCLRSRFRHYVQHTYASTVPLDAQSIVTSTCTYANIASYVMCWQNTGGNCPFTHFSMWLVLSIILMTVKRERENRLIRTRHGELAVDIWLHC